MAARTKTIQYGFGNVSSVAAAADPVFTWDTSTYTDETTDAGSGGGADVPFSATNGSIQYIGSTEKFDGISIDMSTSASGGTRVWEYSQGGSAWATLTKTTVNGSDLLATDTTVYWTLPTDWAVDTVNGVGSKYWIRIRSTVGHTNGGTASCIAISRPASWSKTIYVPETGTRTIRSAFIVWGFTENMAAFRQQVFRCRVGLGATTPSDVYTSTELWSDTGEQAAAMFMADATAYFVSNFGAGASQTMTLDLSVLSGATTGLTLNTTPRTNWWAELYLTYEADEQTTRIKTAVIPLDGNTARLTTSLAELGTNQVPDFDNICPEASKTVRSSYFRIRGNLATSTSTSYTFGVALDAEGETQFGQNVQSGNSSRYDTYLWEKTPSAGSAHAFKARVAEVSVYPNLAIDWVITYEYNHSSTTSCNVSLQIPVNIPLANDATTGDVPGTSLTISEANVSLKQSGIVAWLRHSTAAAVTVTFAVGGQTERSYGAVLTSGLAVGCSALSQRIDAGGAAGLGITFARGPITVTPRIETTDPNLVTSGLLILNYTCDKDAGGDGVHGRTTWWLVTAQTTQAATATASSMAPFVSEASYAVNSIGLLQTVYDAQGLTNLGMGISADCGSGEFGGASVRRAVTYERLLSNGELYQNVCCTDVTSHFDRDTVHTGKLALETSRVWRMASPFESIQWHCAMAVTTYTKTWTVAGTISGHNASLSTVVDLYAGTEKLQSQTLGAGTTSYSFTVFDDTLTYMTRARQDATHVGSSDNGTAT